MPPPPAKSRAGSAEDRAARKVLAKVEKQLERIAARLGAHLGDERTASLLARAREGVIDFHRLSTRRRRLPARLLASTSLRSVASLADELEAGVNREFDRTYGRLIDAAIGT